MTLSETKDDLRQVAESHGWSVNGIDVYELEASEKRLKPEEDYTVFRPEDAELNDTIEDVHQQVERLKPSRAVFDLIHCPRCGSLPKIHSGTVVRSWL